jgi:P27 family predicted phage terminase small subunit
MGRRGPPPKPTKIRALEGNLSRRPLNEREPVPRNEPPPRPDWLDEEAGAKWDHLVYELHNLGVLGHVDGDALAAYCDTWSRWKRAVLFLQEKGDVYTIKDADGKPKYVQQWPQVAIARNLLVILNRYHQEFGLTPASRSRISTLTKANPQSDDFMRRYAKPPPDETLRVVGA